MHDEACSEHFLDGQRVGALTIRLPLGLTQLALEHGDPGLSLFGGGHPVELLLTHLLDLDTCTAPFTANFQHRCHRAGLSGHGRRILDDLKKCGVYLDVEVLPFSQGLVARIDFLFNEVGKRPADEGVA